MQTRMIKPKQLMGPADFPDYAKVTVKAGKNAHG